MGRRNGNRRAVTLIELLVALTIMSVLFAVTAFTLDAHRRSDRSRPATIRERLVSLRRTAIASGVPQTVSLQTGSAVVVVTALPDGRVLAPLSIGDSVAADGNAR